MKAVPLIQCNLIIGSISFLIDQENDYFKAFIVFLLFLICVQFSLANELQNIVKAVLS